MQNEDDLRGLAKVMEFMRAISILFVVINIYWFCYQAIKDVFIHPLDENICRSIRCPVLFRN